MIIKNITGAISAPIFWGALVTLSLFGQQALAALEKNILIDSQAYSLQLHENTDSLVRPEGRQTVGQATHYKGFIMGVEDSWARLSEINGAWQGVVSLYGKLYVVPPVGHTGQQHGFSGSLISRAATETEFSGLCGTSGDHDVLAPRALPLQEATSNNSSFKLSSLSFDSELCTNDVKVDNVCLVARLELVFDSLFTQAFPGTYREQALSLVNMIDGYYRNSVNVIFEAINTTFLDSPYFTESSDIFELLNDIRSKMNARSIDFITDRRALLHLISGRDFDGTYIGLAYTGGVCAGSGYNVGVTQLTGNNIAYTALIAAHELGHNLGAGHDFTDNNCSGLFVMAPYLNSYVLPDSFSSCSIDEIHSTISALRDPAACFKYPAKISITADAGNASTAPAFTEVTNRYSVNVEQGSQALGSVSIGGYIGINQGIISRVQLDGADCSVAADSLTFNCSSGVVITSPLMLEVTVIPNNVGQLEITTSAGIGFPKTVTDITTGDDSVSEVLAITAPDPERPVNPPVLNPDTDTNEDTTEDTTEETTSGGDRNSFLESVTAWVSGFIASIKESLSRLFSLFR